MAFSLCCGLTRKKKEKPDVAEFLLEHAFFFQVYRKRLYALMAEGSIYILDYGVNTKQIGMYLYKKKSGRRPYGYGLFDFMYDRGDICDAENETEKFRMSNKHVINNFIKRLIKHYQDEYGINEEDIRDCSNSFAELFSSIGKDERKLTIQMHKIQKKVQHFVPERLFSQFGTENQYDLLDILFLPLLQTGLRCVVWLSYDHYREVDILMYKRNCAIVMKMECSQQNTAAEGLRKIYKIDRQHLFDYRGIFPNGVEDYVVIVFNLNVGNKALTICSSHERNIE